MVVNHNVPALFTHLSMRRADRGLQQAMTRLSSGVRINSAREDAAGLAIANKLNYQVGGLQQASMNATHGISLIQTAEGALNEVHNMLQRMRELGVQAAHGSLTNDNRAMIQLEIEELTAEIHSISRNTEYNRMRILSGEASRVIDNTVRNAAGEMEISRNIVNTLFVSHHVSPGRMDYTIEQAGRGAYIEFNPNLTPDGTFAENGGITINGVNFSFTEGERWEDVRNRINSGMPFLGMTLHAQLNDDNDPTGRYFLVTNLAGSNQSITVTGDLAQLGVSPEVDDDGNPIVDVDGNPVLRSSDTGQDAIVTVGGLLDINGAPVPGSSLAATAFGNSVSVRGSHGEDIRFNIQVMFDATIGAWRFPNPPPVDGTIADLQIDAMTAGDGLVMAKEFRSFGPIMLQIGPSHNTAMPVQIPRINAETLGLVQYVGGRQRQIIDVRPILNDPRRGSIVQVGAEAAITIADTAIQTVSNVRARLGAYQNRLESTVRNLDVTAENTEISRSRIQDTDMARETTRFAKYNVMFQAAMAIMGQANQRPQQIIALLQ